jgi:hypothetical protein
MRSLVLSGLVVMLCCGFVGCGGGIEPGMSKDISGPAPPIDPPDQPAPVMNKTKQGGPTKGM